MNIRCIFRNTHEAIVSDCWGEAISIFLFGFVFPRVIYFSVDFEMVQYQQLIYESQPLKNLMCIMKQLSWSPGLKELFLLLWKTNNEHHTPAARMELCVSLNLNFASVFFGFYSAENLSHMWEGIICWMTIARIPYSGCRVSSAANVRWMITFAVIQKSCAWGQQSVGEPWTGSCYTCSSVATCLLIEYYWKK